MIINIISFIGGILFGALFSEKYTRFSNFGTSKYTKVEDEIELASQEYDKVCNNIDTRRENICDKLYDVQDKVRWMKKVNKSHKMSKNKRNELQDWYEDFGEFVTEIEKYENMVILDNSKEKYLEKILNLKKILKVKI